MRFLKFPMPALLLTRRAVSSKAGNSPLFNWTYPINSKLPHSGLKFLETFVMSTFSVNLSPWTLEHRSGLIFSL